MNNEATVEQFKADVAAMRVKEANLSAERFFRVLGAIFMILGVVMAIYGVVTDLNAEIVKNGVATATGPAEQRDAMVTALLGLTLAVVGGVLFLRYSLGAYLRYWLARMVFEQQRKG
jgi:hypothetical protein